jgi:hypothetical protein
MAQARARVCFEFGGHLFLIGRTRVGWAMRSLNSREVSLLQPFPSIAAAQQMCQSLARAQIIAFADNEIKQANGRQKRKRHAGRRRREPRIVVEPLSTPAARPSAPRRSSEASPSSLKSRPMFHRSSRMDRRPSPEVVAELSTTLDQLETRSE